jgi:cell division septum initiation protein DivIVA
MEKQMIDLTTVKTGDMVYTINGRQGFVLAVSGGRLIVQTTAEVEHDTAYGPIEMWDHQHVYANLPVLPLQQELAALNEQLAEKRVQLSTLQQEIAAARATIRGYTATLEGAAVDSLRRINAVLGGRVTHYVLGVDDYRYEIKTVSQMKEQGWSNDRHQKWPLLALYPESADGAAFSWKLHQYRDGSGAVREVVPCVSLDEAEKELGRLLRCILAKAASRLQVGAEPPGGLMVLRKVWMQYLALPASATSHPDQALSTLEWEYIRLAMTQFEFYLAANDETLARSSLGDLQQAKARLDSLTETREAAAAYVLNSRQSASEEVFTNVRLVVRNALQPTSGANPAPKSAFEQLERLTSTAAIRKPTC